MQRNHRRTEDQESPGCRWNPALQPVDGRGGDTVENLQEGLHQEQLIQLLEQFTDHVEDLDGVFAATGMKILLVEFGCQDDSELSKAAEQRGWETLRLTRATYDLRTKSAIEQVINLLNDKIHQGYIIVLWGSIPCTPWTRWHDLNAHKYGEEYEKRIETKSRKPAHGQELPCSGLGSTNLPGTLPSI